MLKNDKDVKWNSEARTSFQHIKKAITEALVLVSPQVDKDFLIFSFASPHTIAAVIL